MKRDLEWPMQLSLSGEFRQRPLRERIRDVLLFAWVAFWVTVGIVLVLLAGSVA